MVLVFREEAPQLANEELGPRVARRSEDLGDKRSPRLEDAHGDGECSKEELCLEVVVERVETRYIRCAVADNELSSRKRAAIKGAA